MISTGGASSSCCIIPTILGHKPAQ
uniref:Uncharacterized protein n=1 Tax=Anguilla anguilla TaxID=7936 RepID=A0A0E9R423_ANGAN